MDRINSRKADINALVEKARYLTGEDTPDVGTSALLDDLSARFSILQTLATEKHDQFMALINRWKSMVERRRKMMNVVKSAQFLMPKKPIKSSQDARSQIDEMQVRVEHSFCSSNILHFIYFSKIIFILSFKK